MGLFDKISYALSKRFTKQTVDGAGAIKGVPCQVQNIQKSSGVNTVTFLWEDNAGNSHTRNMLVNDGDKGDTGAQGPKGDKGDKGDTGAKGDTGTAATIQVGNVSSGASANVTNAGTSSAAVFNFTLPKGDKGDTGEKGDDGQDGKSFEIKAVYATYADLIAAHPTGQAGDAYFVGIDTSPDLYTWLSVDEQWYNNGPIAGVKGDKGDTGDDGFSPVATVSKTGDTATIEITDKNGTTRQTVMDGADGADGQDGDDGVGISSIAKTGTSGLVDTYTITYTDSTTDTFTVTNGDDGADGTDGKGITGITKTGTSGLVDTYTITFTDSSTATFTVTNGADGADGQDGADGEGVPSGGSTGAFLIKSSATDYDAEWAEYEKIIPKNAGARNLVFGGRYLGSAPTAAQLTAISNGTFEGLLLGDYWTSGDINYRIAGFDYWLNCGDTQCTDHHIVIVPDQNMLAANGSTTHYMDTSNTTAQGYTGSGFCSGTNSDSTTNTAKATCRTMAQAVFGAGHILSHREYFTTTVADGIPTAGAWTDSDIDLMNERMVYGNSVFEPKNDGITVPALYTIDKSQLPLFAARPDLICNRANWWLRDVVSGSYFAHVNYDGYCYYGSASHAWTGIRPAFGIF